LQPWHSTPKTKDCFCSTTTSYVRPETSACCFKSLSPAYRIQQWEETGLQQSEITAETLISAVIHLF
jgi:hypothetical protein